MKKIVRHNLFKASDCKCCVCGETAVAFYPCIDIDVPHHPYCRKCLSEEKLKILKYVFNMDDRLAKWITRDK